VTGHFIRPWIPLPVLLLAACTSTTASGARARSDVAARLPAIHTAALVCLDVKEYEVSAGGVAEFKEEWSTAAQKALETALIAQLKSRRIELRRIEPGPDTAEELDDLRALTQAVNWSAVAFPRKEFDYSLGSVATLAERYGVDALVFVWARGRLVTGGRKFLAAFAGGGEIDAGQVAITIVDRSGDVLWFNTRGRRGGRADLRYGDSAAELMQAMVSDLPPAPP
jgi:hypothetical protein